MSEQPAVTFPMKVVVPVVVVVVALAIMLIWAPFGSDQQGRDPVRVGHRVSGLVQQEGEATGDGATEHESQSLSARLPYGVLGLQLSTGSSVSVSGTPRVASKDARFVTVRWTPRLRSYRGPLPRWSESTSTSRREPASRLVLVAGGRRYRVVDHLLSSSAPGAVSVAVARATDLSLQVVTGERRQVATAGKLEGVTNTSGDSGICQVGDVYCDLVATRTPYLSGLGMAPQGKDWLVVTEARTRKSTFYLTASAHFVVATWRADGSDATVDYAASGKPTLDLRVSGAGKPVKTKGKPRLTAVAPYLEKRAYLVPSKDPATVSLTYRTTAKPVPGAARPAGSPRWMVASDTAKVTLQATQTAQGTS